MKQLRYIAGIFLALLLIACGNDPTPAPSTSAPPNINPEGVNPTPLALPPTPIIVASAVFIAPTLTPIPMAALVNGDPIFLTAYERELARYQQAQAQLGITPDVPARDFVLDLLVTQTLIVQQAERMGVSVDPVVVEAQIANDKAEAGGEAAFQAWLDNNMYTVEEFNAGIIQQLLTQQLHALITGNIPYSVPKIRARYIQVGDLTLAQDLHTQILNGGDFATLANQHSLDRHTGANGGDLEYFTPNTLLVPAVENAAFALSLNQTSDIIPVANETLGTTTYYIIQVTDISTSQPLDPTQRNQLLAQAFADWIANIKAEANIQILVQ